MWSCPAEGRAVRGPPGKLRIWVTWRGRDRCPSPIDLWVQGMTTCFLVPSLPSMSAREWGGGWNTKTEASVIHSPLCSVTVPTASECTHLGSPPRRSYTGSSQSLGLTRVWGRHCLLPTHEPFPFSTPFFPTNRTLIYPGSRWNSRLILGNTDPLSAYRIKH